MFRYLLTFYFILCFYYTEGFFLFKEKVALKSYLFCLKVCPLYCSPRRSDHDESSLIYGDEDFYIDDETFMKLMNRTKTLEPHSEAEQEKPAQKHEWWSSPVKNHKENTWPLHVENHKESTWPSHVDIPEDTNKEHHQKPDHVNFETFINVYYQPHYYPSGKLWPRTTTPAPTTTEEPSGICMFCAKKCDFPLHH